MGLAMPERAANLRADLILKAMIAVASADAGGLEYSEVRLMQQVYEDQAKRPIKDGQIRERLVWGKIQFRCQRDAGTMDRLSVRPEIKGQSRARLRRSLVGDVCNPPSW